MRRRLTGAILLLYPRRVRKGHGPEIAALIDDLIAREGRSRTGLFVRLAVDGLAQRIASTATVWTVVAVLAATSFGGLAVSDFAAANALRRAPRTVHRVTPAWHMHQAPHQAPRHLLRWPGTLRQRQPEQRSARHEARNRHRVHPVVRVSGDSTGR
jgi:hypothetical protein